MLYAQKRIVPKALKFPSVLLLCSTSSICSVPRCSKHPSLLATCALLRNLALRKTIELYRDGPSAHVHPSCPCAGKASRRWPPHFSYNLEHGTNRHARVNVLHSGAGGHTGG